MNWGISKIPISKFLIFSGIFFISFCLSYPASAKDRFYPDKVYGNASGWTVYRNEWRKSCIASGRYRDGTIFWMGRDRKAGGLFLALANKKWKGIEPFNEYRFNIIFNDRRRWKVNMSGTEIKSLNLIGFEALPINSKFFNEISRARSMTVYIGQKKIVKLYLRGTSRAIKLLNKCEYQKGNQGEINFRGLDADGSKKIETNSNSKYPVDVQKLIDEWEPYYEGCLGGNFEDPRVKKNCENYSRLEKELNAKGYCWGSPNHNFSRAEFTWYECRLNKKRKK